VLETLRHQTEPTTLGQLADAAGLHENTVRGHLDALRVMGLASRSAAAASGRGRPAWLYRATDADPEAPSEYAGLASALAYAIHQRSTTPVQDAITAGRGWGQDLARRQMAGPDPEADPGGATPARTAASTAASTAAARRRVVALLDDLGFAPQPDRRHASVRLTRCPLLEAAHRHPDVVCGVHLGLAQGALEAHGAPSAGTELHAFSEPGACRLELMEHTATHDRRARP
jgi:predicted ArsR family transcriptional regulator